MSEVTVRWLEGQSMRTADTAGLAVAQESGFAWVDVADPDADSLAPIAEAFGLHPLAIEDCLHYPQRPKIENFRSGLFLIWLTPDEPDGEDVPTHEMDVFIGVDHLITVHRGRPTAIDQVAERAGDLMLQGSDYVLHAIIDRLVDTVLDVVDNVADELEAIEDQVIERASRHNMELIYKVRRRLVKLHRIIGPERDIIRYLAREREIIDEEAYRYLQDVGDHLARVEDSIETAREVAAAVMDIYLSSVSNRMNEVMKVLTVVATIFMPLTLISGIYGMNVTRGMWPPIEAFWSFWAVCGAMAVIAVWMILFFRRRGWW